MNQLPILLKNFGWSDHEPISRALNARFARFAEILNPLVIASMATKEEIRTVFADPQVDGMDGLYQCIGELLKDGAEFENAYSLVIAAGDTPSKTWIRFCSVNNPTTLW